MSEKQSPVVFIHGLWLHQSSWQPREDHFSQAGKSTLKQYRHSPAVTDLTKFSDRGHSLTIDSGWREVATLRWFGPTSRASSSIRDNQT